MAQGDLKLKQNTWYELKITYMAQNTGLNIDSEGKIDVTSNWIGAAIQRYTSSDKIIFFPLSSIFPAVQYMENWDEEDKVLLTYAKTNVTNWKTQTIYFKTTPFEDHTQIRTFHYPPGDIEAFCTSAIYI